MTKYWVAHLEDVVRAMKVLDQMKKDLNKGQPEHSDLEFMVPTSVIVQCYDEVFVTLVLEDDEWYMQTGDDQ